MTKVTFDSAYTDASTASTEEPEHARLRQFLEELLRSTDPHLVDRVERTVKRWNRPARDQLRSETGLRISSGARHGSVPIRVEGVIPEPLLKIMLEHWRPSLWKLYFLNRKLVDGGEGLRLALDHQEDVRHLLPDAPDSEFDSLAKSEKFLRKLLEKLAIDDLLRKLLPLHQDVLGRYYPRQPEIKIYWIPIGFVAGLLGISAQALTAIVLTHELAHAYTHLGQDIDDNAWDTEAFLQADLDIVEGLAQFYTAVLADKALDRSPEMRVAFDKLLNVQSGPYVVHQQWGTPTERLGELVRMSMLQTRTRRIVDYAQFLRMLKWAKESLPR